MVWAIIWRARSPRLTSAPMLSPDAQRLRDGVEGDALLPLGRVDGDHGEVLVQVTAGHVREVAA